MLWILIITVAIITISIYFGRRARNSRELTGAKPAAENFRPLFMPSPGEIRRAAGAEGSHTQPLTPPTRERTPQLIAELESWKAKPSRRSTLELISLAAIEENSDTYLEIAKQVAIAWREGRLTDLSADDVAQLLESHYWLLPAGERSSGVGFSLRDEIAGLHRQRTK